ncbi:MAG: DUF6206 family protein [Desulfurococcales archaeon]|nr:DUF6206 family protein [Desulfurococcales archaeon]
MEISVDVQPLEEFEETLDPVRETACYPFKILGYGEISTVIEIEHPAFRGIALKRIPGFPSRGAAESHGRLYEDYNSVLRGLGIETPEYGWVVVDRSDGSSVLYLAQKLLPAESIGNRAIHRLDHEGNKRLIYSVISHLASIWRHNASGREPLVGIDAQISNWSIKDPRSMELLYLDTSTPLLRVNGVEQIDPEVFLKAAPPLIRWLLKTLFLQEILDRYYDPHSILVDLVANYIKEKRGDLVPKLVDWVNEELETNYTDLGIRPLSLEEVYKYYRSDARIWSIYLSSRKLHRFITSKILRRRYDYLLPKHIER